MSIGDAIITIVDKLLEEKEKSVTLQIKLERQQNQQLADEQTIKD